MLDALQLGYPSTYRRQNQNSRTRARDPCCGFQPCNRTPTRHWQCRQGSILTLFAHFFLTKPCCIRRPQFFMICERPERSYTCSSLTPTRFSTWLGPRVIRLFSLLHQVIDELIFGICHSLGRSRHLTIKKMDHPSYFLFTEVCSAFIVDLSDLLKTFFSKVIHRVQQISLGRLGKQKIGL